MSKHIPYIGFGNDTLARQPKVTVGELIVCPHGCAEVTHPLRPSSNGGSSIYFYECGSTPYLAALDGRLVAGLKPDVKGKI